MGKCYFQATLRDQTEPSIHYILATGLNLTRYVRLTTGLIPPNRLIRTTGPIPTSSTVKNNILFPQMGQFFPPLGWKLCHSQKRLILHRRSQWLNFVFPKWCQSHIEKDQLSGTGDPISCHMLVPGIDSRSQQLQVRVLPLCYVCPKRQKHLLLWPASLLFQGNLLNKQMQKKQSAHLMPSKQNQN